MNSEHIYTIKTPPEPDDEAWDVFLSDGDDDPLPDEEDFWIDPDERD
ncbi:MAG: hypothetical protein ACR2NU_05435 [Aeoliella sp.]